MKTCRTSVIRNVTALAVLALAWGCEPRHSGQSTPAPAPPRPVETPLPKAMADEEVATPVTEAYDLAADREARVAAAKKELGERVPTAFAEDVFVVIGEPGTVKLIKDALAAYFNGRFSKRPTRAISIYLFGSAAPYDAYCAKHLGEKCISPYGFYRPDMRRIIMNAGPGLGTLTHELVHPIVETDFPGAPTWIDEGIASLFEGFTMPRPGEIHGVKNWRHPRLLSALLSKEKDDARLEKLFGMPNHVFRGRNESLHYSMARYFCQWMDSRGMLWPFYRKWRDRKDDPSGEKTFAEVTGQTPKEAHDAWEKWVRAL